MMARVKHFLVKFHVLRGIDLEAVFTNHIQIHHTVPLASAFMEPARRSYGHQGLRPLQCGTTIAGDISDVIKKDLPTFGVSMGE